MRVASSLAASVSGPSTVSVSRVDVPPPGEGELLVRMAACGICGSDVEKVFGSYGKPSMRLGHEPAGTVVEAGRGAGFEPGDRVFTHHHVPCGSCRLCGHGAETLCETYSSTNLWPCGLSELYTVPAPNAKLGVLRLPDSVSFEEAAMIEPLACCLRAWKKIPFRDGDSLAVFGAGPTGIMHAMLGGRRASKVFCSDTNAYRLEAARSAGAEPLEAGSAAERIRGAGGADAAVVATGSPAALLEAIRSVRKGGTVMLFGVPPRGTTADFDLSDLYAREVSLVSSYAASDADTREALGMISGALDLGPLITHSFGVADSQKAFDLARSGEGAMKIIVTGKA